LDREDVGAGVEQKRLEATTEVVVQNWAVLAPQLSFCVLA
jgi:hypothetical protein